MNKFDFQLSRYFTGIPLFFGAFLGFIALVVVIKSIVLGIIILLVSITVVTAHYRLEIDLESKIYRDYLWILGMKFGEKEQFEKIEYAYIKKIRVSQTISMRAASTSYKQDVYNGYIRFSEKKKIHLFTFNSKGTTIAKIQKIARALEIRVVDYSEGMPQEV